MEAEYIAFLQSMRDHIPLREAIKGVQNEFTPICFTHVKAFFETIE